jgi:hypothetical protein
MILVDPSKCRDPGGNFLCRLVVSIFFWSRAWLTMVYIYVHCLHPNSPGWNRYHPPNITVNRPNAPSGKMNRSNSRALGGWYFALEDGIKLAGCFSLKLGTLVMCNKRRSSRPSGLTIIRKKGDIRIVFNGNFRILKWRYCTICLAIFC